jgi:glucosylceramidase
MKTNGKMYGQGSLIGSAGNEYHKTWASYYSKFLDSYKSNGVNVWAVTAQNEPEDGCIPNFSFQAMCFNSTTQRDFIKSDLGPQLNTTHPDVLLLILDGQRAQLPKWAQVVLNDSLVSQFVDGIGIHWYEDELTPVDRLVETHDQFPNYFILGTEACAGFLNHTIAPGWWERAEVYALDIINDLNHWVTGWTDWNLALNMQGGPNWANNFVEAPILIDAEKDEFYKGPMFYVLGHFSKFVIPDSIRIGIDNSSIPRELKVSAFITPMNYTVVQVYNLGNFTHRFAINPNDGRGEYIESSIPSHALQSYIFQT